MKKIILLFCMTLVLGIGAYAQQSFFATPVQYYAPPQYQQPVYPSYGYSGGYFSASIGLSSNFTGYQNYPDPYYYPATYQQPCYRPQYQQPVYSSCGYNGYFYQQPCQYQQCNQSYYQQPRYMAPRVVMVSGSSNYYSYRSNRMPYYPNYYQ